MTSTADLRNETFWTKIFLETKNDLFQAKQKILFLVGPNGVLFFIQLPEGEKVRPVQLIKEISLFEDQKIFRDQK